MNYKPKNDRHELLLAIDPMYRGFGFALFEKPNSLIDWGITDIRLKVNSRSLRRIEQLIDFYHPDRIVLEDIRGESSRRCKRVEQLLGKIRLLAKEKKVKVSSYSPKQVQEVFEQFNCHNKYERAKAICEWLPVLTSRMPPKRAIWMSEDPRTNLFDAVALALTYYYLEE
jgi:Holliday junction resolvasome RuvABC endonuclease subunit